MTHLEMVRAQMNRLRRLEMAGVGGALRRITMKKLDDAIYQLEREHNKGVDHEVAQARTVASR